MKHIFSNVSMEARRMEILLNVFFGVFFCVDERVLPKFASFAMGSFHFFPLLIRSSAIGNWYEALFLFPLELELFHLKTSNVRILAFKTNFNRIVHIFVVTSHKSLHEIDFQLLLITWRMK